MVKVYHRLPSEYVPLHAEYPEPLRRFKVLNMIFKSEFSVKNKAKEFSFFDYFYRFVFPRKMLGSGKKNVLLVKVDADCLGGGKLKAVLQSCKEVKYGKE